jgi:hypothetical protein
VNLNIALADGVLLADGWHGVAAGTIGVVLNPQFTDPTTGLPVPPGGPWLAFTGTDDLGYACLLGQVLAVRYTPPAS